MKWPPLPMAVCIVKGKDCSAGCELVALLIDLPLFAPIFYRFLSVFL